MKPQTAALVKVGLTKKSVGAIAFLTGYLGLSQIDVLNRAVQLYHFVVEQTSEGKKLAFYNEEDQSIQLVSIEEKPDEQERA